MFRPLRVESARAGSDLLFSTREHNSGNFKVTVVETDCSACRLEPQVEECRAPTTQQRQRASAPAQGVVLCLHETHLEHVSSISI